MKTLTGSLSPQTLASNTPLILADRIWRVTSGAIALFLVHQGRRRHLFNLKAGDILFPFSASDPKAPQLLALALQPAELVPLTQSEFLDWMRQAPQAAVTGLETWITRLSSVAGPCIPPRQSTPIPTSGLLGPGEIFQPPQGHVAWTRLTQGQAQLLGLEDLHLTPEASWLPLTAHLWVEATDWVELEHHPYQLLRQPQQFLAGVLNLQQKVLTLLIRHLEQEQQQELLRLGQVAALNQAALRQTQDAFVQVFQGPKRGKSKVDQTPTPDLDAALLQAAGAVGRALGVTIKAPAASEDKRRLRNPLEAIARASQLRMRRISLGAQWWKSDCGPLLTFARSDGRPLALLPQGDAGYAIYDPTTARSSRCCTQTAADLASTAYSFYRPLPQALRPLDLLKFARHGRGQDMLLVAMTGLIATVLGMVTPQATALLVDQAIPNGNRSMLVQIGLGLAMVALGTTLFQLAQGVALLRLETHADSATQAAVWDRLLKLKPAFFRQYAIGDLSSRVSAISQIRQSLGNTVLKSIFSGLFSFLNLGLLFFYSAPLAAIALVVAAINIAVTVVAGIFTLRQTRPLLERQGKLFGVMVQLINGVSKFRIAGAEDRAFAYWGKQYSQQLNLMLGTQGIEDTLAVVNSLLSTITPAILFAFATHLMASSKGDFTLPTFLAFNSAFGTFIAGATSLSTTVVDILEVWPIWQRAQPILTALPEVDLEKADPGRLRGQVAIAHAQFRYREDGPLNLDDVSIQAEPGEFIALVGPSGSGKSTLLRLLLGFDPLESGAVLFDGQDLASLDVNAVRRQLGVVLQNSRLMSASIFDNIASGANISMEEAWEAARMSGLARDVEAMPMGMHTVVSEGGTNLSGGQRQRLLIARALALRPRILLFDEATSALDNRTQQIVSDSLDRLKVTRIVVAHRLSTIRNADRIYVLQNGRLIQQGKFDALAAEPGLFQQLAARQSV